MNYVGNSNDVSVAYDVGKVIAEELRVFGINMDFAPVIDVYSNLENTVIGKRSFGNDSTLVSKMGIHLAKGLLENGVIPVYKHFPGHGNTSVDSHYFLPIVDKTKDELYSLDLIPFMEAIDKGAEVIMIGHLAVPSITGNEVPASLSKELITRLLKEEMGYNGLVVTDALNMGALTKYYSQEEVYVKAIEAGVDLLLMPSSSRKALSSIRTAIEEGLISEERIDESVKEIILANSTSMDGETTALFLSKLLNSKNIIVSRLGYGIPMGTQLEYADEYTLSKAFEGRKKID
jgi:beta-N-acetylhexosaminidase